ncbi:MAG TPA: histidine ammonia-lyase [Gemmatimonadales bacterium]|nr:histidine ammonia-lyase [Gemmatimonadales bacterium]
MAALEIDGHHLRLEDVERVATGEIAEVRLAAAARGALQTARRLVEDKVARGEPVYGVTTGFGRLAEVVIPAEQRVALQRNVIRSHASGAGAALDRAATRALMLLRANTLAHGHSGCSPAVVELLLDCLNAGVHPVVPEFGSVGASGDLVPLAHVGLALIGEGEVEHGGRVVPAAEALHAAHLAPVELKEKDGLALINGTQFTTALAVLALLEAERALEALEVAGALSLEGLRGSPVPFDADIHAVRPHQGQAVSAGRLRALLEGSEIRESHRHGDPRLQDAYSLRCMPQVHGAAREALAYARRALEIEVNSATDNPLVFPESGQIKSGGNFHGQVIAQAADFLAIALADLGAISERRVERLLNPDESGLSAFLAGQPGVESGLMTLQVTVADLLTELRLLAAPASTQSVPTGAGREDHVSMGPAAARKARRAAECLVQIVAVELICAAEAIEQLRPLKTSPALEQAWARIRERVPRLSGDRALAADVRHIGDLVRRGSFRAG